MLFNSIEFLIFLPLIFVGYWFIFKPLRLQNLFIVLCSYLFYGWWDWRFLLLISFTTICSFYSGILIDKNKSRPKCQRFISGANIILNLAILCIFKYFNFFVDNFAALCGLFGFTCDWVTLNIVLPVGISFYTFQALSYSIDIYRKKMPVCTDIIAFMAYISFFPQLVAGPIERATNLLPQFLQKRKFDYASAVDGMQQILWGFFKKLVIADNCSRVADYIFANYAAMDSGQLALGAIMFSFQIYGDFSGYSDIAIGTARLFGITLMKNFNFPYFSRDIAEFWRRWHISLTTWFRDYIYIPLGGSREGRNKSIRNTFIIFFVSGFWHGANWTFVLWGVVHACLFLPLFIAGTNRKNRDIVASNSMLPSWHELLQMTTTFIFVALGWIIFRAEDIHQAGDYILRLFSFQPSSVATLPLASECIYYIIILLLVEWVHRHKDYGLQIQYIPSKGVRIAIYTILLILIQLTMGQSSEFIYFQF